MLFFEICCKGIQKNLIDLNVLNNRCVDGPTYKRLQVKPVKQIWLDDRIKIGGL